MNETQHNFQAAPQGPPPARPEPGPYQSYQWSQDLRRKSPILAGLLSLMPGLGQIYVGYYQQGFINVVIIGSTISLMQGRLGNLMPLAAFFLIFYWLFNVIDASRRAMFYNEIMEGTDPREFPENFQMPGTQGSLVGGIILIALGAVALSNTLFDVPLDWLEDWWPAALILGGVLLLAQWLQKDRRVKAPKK
ncbi:MAG: DUF5668 domain-containing protein [Acidobacteriota bacterium]